MKKDERILNIDELQSHPNLKAVDPELISFFEEMFDTNLNSEFSTFVYKHGMSYLDSLCSIRFNKCPRSDKRQIVKVMEMILKKTNERIAEAKDGIEAMDH